MALKLHRTQNGIHPSHCKSKAFKLRKYPGAGSRGRRSYLLGRMDPETWSLISPVIAKLFRVIPLGRKAGQLRLLTDVPLSERNRKKKQSQLACRLQTNIRLEVIRSEEDRQQFAEIFERYYSVNFSCLTVLLIDPEASWAHFYTDVMKKHGHQVIHVESITEALAAVKPSPRSGARSPARALNMVLIADEIDGGLGAAKEKVCRAVGKIPVLAVSEVDPGQYRKGKRAGVVPIPPRS